MIQITVNQNKKNAFLSGMHKLISALKFNKAIDDSLDILKKEAELNFDQQGRIYSKRGSWQPLAASTRIQRAKAGYGAARPILVRSGKLKGSFRKVRAIGNKGSLKNTADYATYHQTGTRKMPQREIVGISSKSRGAIQRVFSNYIAKEIKRSLG